MQDRPDSELMGLYAEGSAPAFEELFSRYEAQIYGYFLRRVGCEATARDLYQELFLRLHRFRHTYDPSRPFEPWFFQVARSVIVDDWRQRQRQVEVSLIDTELRSLDALAEGIVAARQEAAHALEILSPEHARILVDAKVRGFEHAEIASALSKSVDAVKQTVSRSLRRLREAHVTGR